MSDSASPDLSSDRNLLFAVLALQADLIDSEQFVEVCRQWGSRPDRPMADLVVDRGWLTPEDRVHADRLVDRKVQKHGGDVRAGLKEATTDRLQASLGDLRDTVLWQTVAPNVAPPVSTSPEIALATPAGRDRYTLTHLHATGGMGQVWLARDDALGREVAFKELRPDRAENATVRARFLQEARITGQLDHPGVVPIYEFGLQGEKQAPFYTMRFVRGRTLAEAAAQYHDRRAHGRAGTLELRELLTAFISVCNAVGFAHSRGVVHRDLKPHNVLLGDYGEVVLLDWGIARLVDAPDVSQTELMAPVEAGSDLIATMQGQALGTPAYMAPEQAEGRLNQIGARTDVYGLGAILYEVLTARPPFDGEDPLTILRRVSHEQPRPPHLVDRKAPRALEAVCLKALAKNPADRYGSAKELAAEVERWLADEAVTAWQEPTSVRVGRWVRRHRTGVASALVALVVAVSGLAAVAAVQAQSGRQLAAKNRELEQSNANLAAARDRAERRVDLALGAIENFRSTVDGNLDVQNKPENEGLRKALLKAPLAFYQQLRDELHDVDADAAAAQFKLANAYVQVGELNREVGSQADAVQAYDEAIALLEPLAGEGSDVGVRQLLAKAFRRRGQEQSQMTTTTAAALASLDRARALSAAIAGERPGDVQAQLELVSALTSAANLHARRGEAADGLKLMQQAITLLEEAARTDPGRAGVRTQLANAHWQVADILRVQKGREADALAAAQAALAVAEPLAREHPDSVADQENLMRAYGTLAVLSETGGAVDQWRAYCEKKLAVAEAVARAHPTVGRLQSQRVTTIRQLASALDAVGKTAEGAAALASARTIAEGLVRDNPTNTSYREVLGDVLNAVAVAEYTAGKPAAALATIEAQAAALEELVRLDPGVVGRQRDLAGAYYNCGVLNGDLGQLDKALPWYERSLAARERLATEHPDQPRLAFDVSSTLGNIAWVYNRMHRLEEARAAYERAIAVLSKLVAAHPENASYRSYLARSQSNLGATLTDLDRVAEAIPLLQAAAAAGDKILAEHPDVVQNQMDTAMAFKQLGDALRMADRAAEAIPAYNRSVDLWEKQVAANAAFALNRAKLAEALVQRGRALRQAGQAGEAVRDFRRGLAVCTAAPQPTADVLAVQASCEAGLAAAAETVGSGLTPADGAAAADRAVAALRRAVAAGYHDAGGVRGAKVFDVLRSREDFRALQKELDDKAAKSQ